MVRLHPLLPPQATMGMVLIDFVFSLLVRPGQMHTHATQPFAGHERSHVATLLYALVPPRRRRSGLPGSAQKPWLRPGFVGLGLH
jgi:hypothetical protein